MNFELGTYVLCFYIFLTLFFLGPTKTLKPTQLPTQLPNNDLLESDDNAENSEDEELGEMKSAHELRTLRLQKKIQQIETEAVKDKPWQMTGKFKSILHIDFFEGVREL